MNNKKNSKVFLSVLAVILLTLAVLGISYALGTVVFGGNNNTVGTGLIDFYYREQSNALNIISNGNIDDVDGKVLNDYFSFDVGTNATGKVTINYIVYFTPLPGSTLDKDAVKLYLTRVDDPDDPIVSETEVIGPSTLDNFSPTNLTTLAYDEVSNNYAIYTSQFNFTSSGSETHYYRLRLWVDSNYDLGNPSVINEDGTHSAIIGGQEFKLLVNVYGYANPE